MNKGNLILSRVKARKVGVNASEILLPKKTSRESNSSLLTKISRKGKNNFPQSQQ